MRKFMINVNGNSYEVEVEEIGGVPSVPVAPADPVAAAPAAAPAPVAAAAPAPAPANVSGTEVEAPMPGVILSVDVAVGDQVKEGDNLVILEAMKMENEILAPCDGKVAAIQTSKGASVNTGDILVVIA